MIIIKKSLDIATTEVELPISKSIFNRIAIIKAISGVSIKDIANLQDDCMVLQKALSSDSNYVNIGHAGTAMRFLTAYYTLLPKEVILHGSDRMHQRPIAELVDSLNELGADIEYFDKPSLPPLRIGAKTIEGGDISMSAGISSQFVSALLLIAPAMPLGLKLTLLPPVVSMSYINMTIELMRSYGIEIFQKDNEISIAKQEYTIDSYNMEYDWSSASFLYEMVALNPGSEVLLKGLDRSSLQHDSQLEHIYSDLGVETSFTDQGVLIKQVNTKLSSLELDCTLFPDLSIPIVFTCAGLGLDCHLIGLETLLFKESNRILVMQKELSKIGINSIVTESSISMSDYTLNEPTEVFDTYEDHRIAMSIAPLASVLDSISINDPEVVTKSFPAYWKMMESFFEISQS